MLKKSNSTHQTDLFGIDLLLQLDPNDPLLKLFAAIPWHDFEEVLSIHYQKAVGAPRPIRLMVGLLLLKQLENLSDEAVVVQWKHNPYYQAFCGMSEYQRELPCHSTELVHFRKCIGKTGVEKIFRMSVSLMGNWRWKSRSILIPQCMRRISLIRRTVSWPLILSTV